MSARTVVAVSLSAALAFGGIALAAQATATPPGSVGASGSTALAAPVAAPGALDPALAARLAALVDEERMAHDLYQLFSDSYGQARPFSMIVRSETQHVAAMRSLLAAYGMSDPTTSLGAGSYATPAIQALYDQWKTAGLASVSAAEQVGVDLETRDIADLEAVLATTVPADVRATLERLVAASKNHLRAFTTAVGTSGDAGMPCGEDCPAADSQRGPGNGMGNGMGNGTGNGTGNGMGNRTGGAGAGNGCSSGPGSSCGNGRGAGTGFGATNAGPR